MATNGMVQQKDGGLVNEFELVPKGEQGDVVTQDSAGNYKLTASRSPGGDSWRFSTSVGAPASGRITLDNATQDSATKVYIHKENIDGVDLGTFLTQVVVGDGWYIQDQASADNYKFWSITNVTDQGTYFEYDITPISFGDNLSNNTKVIASARPDAGNLAAFSSGASRNGEDINNLLVRVSKMGWAYYTDSAYTSGSPLTINNSRTLMPIDGLGSATNKDYLPDGVTDLWDTATSKILSDNVGNAFEVRVQFIAEPATSNDTALDVEFDIGTGAPDIVISESTITSPKGTDPFVVSIGIPLFSLATFVANGCKVYINTTDTGDNFDCYGFTIMIKQDYFAN